MTISERIRERAAEVVRECQRKGELAGVLDLAESALLDTLASDIEELPDDPEEQAIRAFPEILDEVVVHLEMVAPESRIVIRPVRDPEDGSVVVCVDGYTRLSMDETMAALDRFDEWWLDQPFETRKHIVVGLAPDVPSEREQAIRAAVVEECAQAASMCHPNWGVSAASLVRALAPMPPGYVAVRVDHLRDTLEDYFALIDDLQDECEGSIIEACTSSTILEAALPEDRR